MKNFVASIGRSLTRGKNLWQAIAVLAVCFAALFSLISISATEGFYALALVALTIWLATKKLRPAFPSFFWPLLVYAVLSLVSSAFSVNPGMSLLDSRDLLLLLVAPIVYMAVSKKEELRLVMWALFASGLGSSIYSISYYLFQAYPGERVKGFMGHYMTQAGILLLFGAFALGIIFFGKGITRIAWGMGLLLAAVSIVLTLTRSAWIGLAVALCVILALWKPRTLVLVPVVAALVFFASPQTVKKRALSIFSLRGYSNAERVQYFKAGIKIIRDFPLFGTGPDTVDMVFQNPKYGLGETAKRNVHLHDNFIQIAAERGIATLAVWLAFIICAFLELLKRAGRKAGNPPVRDPLAVGALAAFAAFVVAGFFEYNFGDSEVVTLFLLILTLPFIPARRFSAGSIKDPERAPNSHAGAPASLPSK